MAEYWGAERIGQRLGVTRSTVWQLFDRGHLLAFTRRRGPRKYLWTNDALILLTELERVKAYAKERSMRKLLREALRAGHHPAAPAPQPAPLARTAGQGSGGEQAIPVERPHGCLGASTDAVAHVPPIRVGGSVAEEQGASSPRSASSSPQSA